MTLAWKGTLQKTRADCIEKTPATTEIRMVEFTVNFPFQQLISGSSD